MRKPSISLALDGVTPRNLWRCVRCERWVTTWNRRPRKYCHAVGCFKPGSPEANAYAAKNRAMIDSLPKF